jgi:hypothetical protein
LCRAIGGASFEAVVVRFRERVGATTRYGRSLLVKSSHAFPSFQKIVSS